MSDKKDKKCPICGVLISGRDKRSNKYCTRECHFIGRYNNIIEKYLLDNTVPIHANTLKKFLTDRDGYKCATCGITSWNNKPISLELEHSDGNSSNNDPDNLCLLCPNCHSQTSTYKGRNIGNGRAYRRQRYQEGKSY